MPAATINGPHILPKEPRVNAFGIPHFFRQSKYAVSKRITNLPGLQCRIRTLGERNMEELPPSSIAFGDTLIEFKSLYIVGKAEQTIPVKPIGLFALPGEINALKSKNGGQIVYKNGIYAVRVFDQFGIIKFALKRNKIVKAVDILRSLAEPADKERLLLSLEVAVDHHEIEQAAAEQFLTQLRGKKEVGILALSILAKWKKATVEELTRKSDLNFRQLYYVMRGLIFLSTESANSFFSNIAPTIRYEVINYLLSDPNRTIKEAIYQLIQTEQIK
jgi:hypothetical protein